MSIPDPDPLVVNYAYLRHRDSETGHDQGSCCRAFVEIGTLKSINGQRFRVPDSRVPNSPPIDPFAAVEIPQRTKRRLGLDIGRCWIVESEVNCFE